MKTQRVRIAVVINDKGEWNASGHFNGTDREAADIAIDGFDQNSQCEMVHFIEAEVPVPEPQTIEGTAGEGKAVKP